ncbi:MAG: hypothetical protein ACW97Z_00195 [Candidatus Hodarchaeales archaeon]|jgi:hypothetical protein
MRKLWKVVKENAGKEALNISMRAVSGTMSNIAEESFEKHWEKSRIVESVK